LRRQTTSRGSSRRKATLATPMSMGPASIARRPGAVAEPHLPRSRRIPRAARRHAAPAAALALMVTVFYAPFLLGGTAQWDAIEVHYSAQRYFSEAIRAGHLPFWTPYLFAGFPFLADLQVGAWYPLNWPFFMAGVTPDSMNLELLVHSLIACGGAYALAMRVIGRRPAAMASGLFYGLSGYFAAHSQHVGMFQTAAWLPWLVLVLDMLGERLSPRRLALAGFLGAALALPGHFQTALYAFSFSALWAALDAVWRRSGKRAARLTAALGAVGGWGVLLSSVMIVPGLELVRQSLRTQLDAAQVGLGYFQVESLFTLVQPNYYGVLLDSRYTGPGDVTQHYFYAGILLVPLALIGLSNGRVLRVALFLGLPFVWYALGPGSALFDISARWPGFGSVELPMHGWFLPALGLALLGGAGVAALQRWLGWRALALLLAVLFADVFVFNSLQNRLAFARHTAEELYLAPLRSFQTQLAAARPPVERLYGPPMAAVVYRNHALQSRVETTYGYNPLELTRYADYIQAAQYNPRLAAGLAASHYLGGPGTIEPIPDALPLAYFAPHVTWLSDAASTRVALDDLDPAHDTVALGQPRDVQPDPAASVRVVERGDDYLILRYQAAGSNLMRIAIPIFPGWHASRDGVELPTLTVDHAFIGVLLPPGGGDVRVWYAPRYFWLGAVVSALALVGALGVLLGLTSRFGLTK
jgi:Bacterial membrane protein YfhO